MTGNSHTQWMHFVLIDDDPVSNMLAKNIIRRHFESTEFSVFTDPEEALAFLEKITSPVLVLLDINMPTLSGWDVLDRIELFPKQTNNMLQIYIVSSSIDIDDHDRASQNHLVLGYLEKPVTTAQIMRHFAGFNSN